LAASGSLKKSVFLLLLLASAAAIGWRLWSLSEANKAKSQAKSKPPVPVLTAEATVQDVPVVLTAVGRAEAYESVTLKSRVDGQVAAVAYTEGQHVRKGDVLVELDPEDFQARLRQAEANRLRDEALLARAKADLERYTNLKGKSYVSDEKLLETRTTLSAAEAVVKADRAAVELARLQASYALIRAPFEGMVGARLVSPGAAVKVNETPLAVLNRLQPIYVSFAVPERHLLKLRAALRAAPVKVEVTAPGDTTQSFEGEARFLDNAVDVATGTIQMKAVLANEDESLTPGQFLEVRLRIDTLPGAVTVPAEAVQQGPEGAFVFVLRPDQTTEQRPVEVALVQHGIAALDSGLEPGETVITDGHSRITPGAKVKVRETGSEKPGASEPAAPNPAGR